jgi:hypothetical protein
VRARKTKPIVLRAAELLSLMGWTAPSLATFGQSIIGFAIAWIACDGKASELPRQQLGC